MNIDLFSDQASTQWLCIKLIDVLMWVITFCLRMWSSASTYFNSLFSLHSVIWTSIFMSLCLSFILLLVIFLSSDCNSMYLIHKMSREIKLWLLLFSENMSQHFLFISFAPCHSWQTASSIKNDRLNIPVSSVFRMTDQSTWNHEWNLLKHFLRYSRFSSECWILLWSQIEYKWD